MASENAKMVAREVLETIRKGKRVDKGDIIRKNGYAEATSTVPSLVTNTKSYQNEIKPIVERWQNEVVRIQDELEQKDLSKERYEVLITAVDKLNKQIQLATGGYTEQQKIIIVFDDSFRAREIEQEKTSRQKRQ
jgi:hypothetical protein